MDARQDIEKAVAARDYDALRHIAMQLSMEDDAQAKAISDRVYVAAAIVEVAQRADGLDYENGRREPRDAIEACQEAIAEAWPSRHCIMTEWVMRAVFEPSVIYEDDCDFPGGEE